MHEEEKKFRTSLADANAGVAGFEAVMNQLAPLQERVGKGHAIIPREIGAIVESGRAAIVTAKTGLAMFNSAMADQEEDDEPAKPAAEPQPNVPTPPNPQPTSTAAHGETPEPWEKAEDKSAAGMNKEQMEFNLKVQQMQLEGSKFDADLRRQVAKMCVDKGFVPVVINGNVDCVKR